MSETVLKGGISYTEGEIEYIWHTEEGACEKCQALNGLKFKNTDEIPDKPHPNCRCWIEAVDGNNSGNESSTSNPNPNELPEDDELCDCWDKIQEIMDEIEELDGDIKSNIEEVVAIQDELNIEIGNIEALINKILSLNSNYNFKTLKYLKITGNIAIIATLVTKGLNAYKVFNDYKENMINKIGRHNDKYWHTKANCDVSKQGIIDAGYATLLSVAKEIYDYYRKTQKLHMDSKSVIKDCQQDLYVDWEGIKQGLKGGVCEIKAIEMEEKFRYNKK